MTDTVTYYPPETRVMPLTLIRRERLLPTAGKVMVKVGDRVPATQVVAQADVTGEVRIVNIARALRVPPGKAARFLKVKEGDDIKAGGVLAARGVLGGTRATSPVNGFISRIDKSAGRVLIQVVAKPFELVAYLPGAVTNIVASQGVTIEATGALIQGTVGFGGEAFGVLHIVANEPTDVLRAKAIDVSAHGAIIVGGAWIDESALQIAQQLQAKGIIAGSMEGRLLELARSMPFPIILTEGLGKTPMARPIFKLLQSQSGREAALSGITRTRWGIARPEILIPLPADSKPVAPPAHGTLLSINLRVRVVRGPHQGEVGAVTALYDQPRRIESGARAYGAEVNLDASGKIFVPLTNLEILR
jgi:hypothetical protein